MFINAWSISLLVCAAAALFLTAGATRTAIRVVRRWSPDSDTAAQIRLENETWLAALYVQYGMVLQVMSLLLLVLAADNFSRVLVGAMCATGAFLANSYGLAALTVKVTGVFFYGFWLVLHRLDLRSRQMALTRVKFYYLLGIGPLLLIDIWLTLQYLSGLQPDIITSCCGIVFAGGAGDGKNMVGAVTTNEMFVVYTIVAMGVISMAAFLLFRCSRSPLRRALFFDLFFAVLVLFFFLLSLYVITAVISPYIYAMPSHRCPFDILQPEYGYVGYPIYFLLISSTFMSFCAAVAPRFAHLPDLSGAVQRLRRRFLQLSLLFYTLFLIIIFWFPFMYHWAGGER